MVLRLIAGLVVAVAAACVPAIAQDVRVPSSAGEIRLSYAPVVKRVAPAVVNVYAARVVENRVPKPTVDNLKSRGHMVETGPDWSEGRLTAASKVGRRRRAAANPRGMQGYAAGR